MPCAAPSCTRRPYTRCAECLAEVCSDHAEDCEACGKTFCPRCFRHHLADLEEAG
ncbi:MAG TPA: hypothetical protein VMS96_00750 [Terriglobales bacterium]|nr:hypothetical protein [Terriglobales bacterium]